MNIQLKERGFINCIYRYATVCDLCFCFPQWKGISHMIYFRNGENLPGHILAKHFVNNKIVNIDVSDGHGQYEPNYKNCSKW